MLGALSIGQAAHAEDVGAIAGEFSVASGAASYTIPIQMPPGPAGMQSKITLNCASRGGDGLPGLSWHSDRVRSIIHCAASVGRQGGVMRSPSDRFCLDGQDHLVLANMNSMTREPGAVL